MKMYTAVAKGANYEIVARSAGLVDLKECERVAAAEPRCTTGQFCW